jgi:hypothetical protein
MANNLPTCPKCGERNIRYGESHKMKDHVRRRKICRSCDYRFTTYELSSEYFEKLRKAAETLDRIRSCFGEESGSGVAGANPRDSCDYCIHMSATQGCTMGFPEAGGDFAKECFCYTELV